MGSMTRATVWPCAVLVVIGLGSVGSPTEGAEGSSGRVASTRADDAVIVSGAQLAELQDAPVSDLHVYRWDGSASVFEPVPYQFDEKVDHVFNPGGLYEFREVIHNVFREDDGALDALDELVFLMRDTGARAPADATWPQAAGPLGYELEVVDPLSPGSPSAWVYLFVGADLERSTVQYITWDGSRTSGVSTEVYDVGFVDRWLLTTFRVKAPCGSGLDLIDRVKGRAGFSLDRGESEENWNISAFYLGSVVGPVRAVRYVRGAMSGLNTIHHDIVYRAHWDRRVNLRVHGLSDIWLYIDMLPHAGMTLLSEVQTSPVAIDGERDTVPSDLPTWTLMRSAAGGLALLYDVPFSPFVLASEFLYKDDRSFNDKPVSAPTYSDDDDSAYGVHGVHLDGLVGEETDTIPLGFRIHPLCGDEGDAAMGALVRSRYDAPLQTVATARRGVAAVRDLVVRREFGDVVLEWGTVQGSTSYRVYRADTPDLPPDSWVLLGETSAPGFRDPAEADVPQTRFYSVTAVGTSGEGPR